MFKNSLRMGLARDMAGRRIERKTKPSLEHLDDRVAPSGYSAAVTPAYYMHAPIGTPTHIPLVVPLPRGQFAPDGEMGQR